MEKFTIKELKIMKNRIFALLPMYEEEKFNEISILIVNMSNDLELLKDNHVEGDKLFHIITSILNNLYEIKLKIMSSGNHKYIKRYVFEITNDIDRWFL